MTGVEQSLRDVAEPINLEDMMTIAEYNAAPKREREIEDCAKSMYEELGRSEEYAHDGEYLPEEYRAEVYRKIAEKALSFAAYLDKSK